MKHLSKEIEQYEARIVDIRASLQSTPFCSSEYFDLKRQLWYYIRQKSAAKTRGRFNGFVRNPILIMK
jgi:hypothetical protein